MSNNAHKRTRSHFNPASQTAILPKMCDTYTILYSNPNICMPIMNDQGKGGGSYLPKDSGNPCLSTNSMSRLAWVGSKSGLKNKKDEITMCLKKTSEDKDAVHDSTNNHYRS